MKYYMEHAEAAVKKTESTLQGLADGDAKERLERNGPNKLKEPEKEPLLTRFAKQLKDPMIIVLLAAALVSGITAFYAGESFADVIIILAVVVINAVLGVYQESKAEKAIEALQKMSAAVSRVYRDGKIQSIKSEELVVGDVILLEAGDAVPADGRILECASMKVEEAALTGESVPVEKQSEVPGTADGVRSGKTKDIPLGDRKNMVYMGGTVVYGRGTALVTATGMETEMGKIADALAKAKESQTPLQKKLTQLSKTLSILVLGICVFIFIFSVVRAGDFHAEVLIDTFMVAVSLAVAAIPEGLATVVTIVLAIGVTNMSKKKAIIRKLTAVETLGCAQVVCSDKTGTLTQNKMTVTEFSGNDRELLAETMALCNDAEAGEGEEAVGEPTEAALVNYASSLGISKNELKKRLPRVAEAPFDSMRKMMSTVHQKAEGGFIQYTKGAPDEILKCCTSIWENGSIRPMTEKDRKWIESENKRMADRALRVLAGALKETAEKPEDTSPASLERDLVFVGLTGMIDPVRPEVKAAIQECRQAGIRPVMITGDHRDTAAAIAMELGIIDSADQAVTGAELDDMDEEEFRNRIGNYSVYARVQPEHKVRIVQGWQAKGMVTAMTGDGVNDAPSIKNADIGVGMGITGTDVTKNVADMVLADDNFATIVSAVSEGRRIYDNIRKAIQFLLASNLSEVLSVFVATLLGFIILKPVHLLWINLITDCFPALALGMEEAEEDIMRRKPRDAKDGVFSGGLGTDVIYQGILVSILTLAAYFIGHRIEAGVWEIAPSADGITMAFLTMSMTEIFHSFNMRSQRKSVFTLKGHNKALWGAMLFSLVLTTVVIYVPFLADAFGFEHISLMEYITALLLAFLIIPAVEMVKWIQRRR
ncbi:cation-translocating P-type ATPase [[Clostridium] symbiosum]|uniref:cation-translocating P-type ATPase n=1 Tax=Clostridium symbiosum TaxID=1512 RepID=UPI001D090551|nr:cation-translocating P-type ATPase [[Clostridium] symbiosum]MCB6609570.1 cation-translocating P-type ATPase [[Clostridium] symbiosum]MCB6931514.1 cation-translocating P-type ATPase [[Clostridium] symbiosum]